MQRLVDANALREEILDDEDYIFDNDTVNHFLDLVDLSPTIDAEPVVRCKDCKYSVLQELYGVLRWCCKLEDLRQFVDENHYCGYGAKMDEEQR